MAKKKELTLNEIRRCVNLLKDYNSSTLVDVADIAKELGVKKLDLWEFIQINQTYFELDKHELETYPANKAVRYIKHVWETPVKEVDEDEEVD